MVCQFISLHLKRKYVIPVSHAVVRAALYPPESRERNACESMGEPVYDALFLTFESPVLQYRQVCESIDNGHIPEGIEKLLTPSNPNRKPQKPVVKAESDSEETPYDILMDVLGEPGTSQQAGEGSQSSPDGSYGWSPSTNNPKEMSRSSSSSDSTQSSSHSPITPNQEDPRTTSFLNILESILRAPSSSASDSVNTSDMGGHALDELGAIASPSVSFQACSPSVFHHVVHDYGQIPKYPVSSSSQTSYSGNDGMDVGSGFEGDMNVETSVSQIAFVSTDGLQAFPDTTAVSAPTVCDTNGMSYTTPSASSSPAEPFWYKVNVSAVGQVTGDAQHDAALLNRFRTTSSWFPSAVHDQPTNQITPNTPSPEDIQEILSSTP